VLSFIKAKGRGRGRSVKLNGGGECALKSFVLKTMGARGGIDSLGKRKAVVWCFGSSTSESGWASDGNAWRGGVKLRGVDDAVGSWSEEGDGEWAGWAGRAGPELL
jgi:hypothetical protein